MAQVVAEWTDQLGPSARQVLVEQVRWLISLRWIAAAAIVVAGLIGTYIVGMLNSGVPLYVCAGVLLLVNILYFLAARGQRIVERGRATRLGLIQIELDLIILTAVLHVAGGVVNPFFLFYFFHVIIAAIILPRRLSLGVGLTAIGLFGLLAVNELYGGALLGRLPLQFSSDGGFWRNPVYALAGFVAFVCTVVLAQYLTRMVVARVTSMEMEAARNGNLLDAVINAMGEGLVFIERDGQVKICNPEAQRWKAGDRTAEASDPLEEFPGPLAAHLKCLVAGLDVASQAGKRIEFETGGLQQRFIDARSCSVVGADGEKLGHVVVGQDMTERKKLTENLLQRNEQIGQINEMLKRSQIEMAQREKMVALGQMATGIAHEIGNPLASLSSVVQYLARQLDGVEEKESLAVIGHHVGRISEILKRMLSLSSPAGAECRWADIDELIDNTVSLVRFDKRAGGVTFENVHNPDLPMVWLNPQHFEQCLLNIVINALDAIEAKPDSPEKILQLTRRCEDETVVVSVRDTGIGMSPEVCRRAFESFFTTKEMSRGTGLGLFISYNLINEIDGQIDLESEVGVGTTVTIRIPVRPKKALIAGQGAEGAANTSAQAS